MEKPVFRASDVLGMAVELERQGQEFYQAFLNAGGLNLRIKQIFEFLVAQERRHEEIFRDMQANVPDSPLPESYPSEMRSYMDSFVRKRVFYEKPAVQKEVAGMENYIDAIAFAVTFEERSISFYRKVKEAVRTSEHKDIDGIIREEHNHILRLKELREEFEK